MLYVGSRIVAQLDDFIAYALDLMRHDETDVMEELWRLLTEETVVKISENLIKVLSVGCDTTFMKLGHSVTEHDAADSF